MIIDLLILLPWVAFGVLGFRDATVRKLVAISVAIIAMFLGQWLMHDIGKLFVEHLHVQPANAPMTAFLYLFLILFFLQSILYRFLTGNYKLGGVVDRIFGVVFGLVEGAIVISIIIFILTLDGPPSRKTIWDSRLYAPTAAIAPQIMDFFSTLLPSAQKSLENLTSPGEGKVDSTLNSPRQ
jgi:membrane protein required for colicin V production